MSDLDIFNRYKLFSEVFSGIAETSIAIVLDNKLLSLSSPNKSQSFIEKNIVVSDELLSNLSSLKDDFGVVKYRYRFKFLSSGFGKVYAYFRVLGLSGVSCFFVAVGGTKYEVIKSTRKDEMNRFNLINSVNHILFSNLLGSGGDSLA